MPNIQKGNASSKISNEDLRVNVNIVFWSLNYSGY